MITPDAWNTGPCTTLCTFTRRTIWYLHAIRLGALTSSKWISMQTPNFTIFSDQIHAHDAFLATDSSGTSYFPSWQWQNRQRDFCTPPLPPSPLHPSALASKSNHLPNKKTAKHRSQTTKHSKNNCMHAEMGDFGPRRKYEHIVLALESLSNHQSRSSR